MGEPVSTHAVKKDLKGRVIVALILALVALACLQSFRAWSLLLLGGLGVATWELARACSQASSRARLACLLEGLVVGGGLLSAILLYRNEHGLSLLVLTLLGVAATDTGAYFGGRKFGRPRTFFPHLSPNKSRAGAIVGYASGSVVGVVGMLVVYNQDHTFPLLAASIAALLVPIVAIFGDLLESRAKRLCGIKDFTVYGGRPLLGPHGGVTDRIDALAAGWLCVCLVVIVSGSL